MQATKNKNRVKRIELPTALELHLTELKARENVVIPPVAFPYIREAMKDFAEMTLRQDRKKQRNEVLQTLKSFPKPFALIHWEIQKMYIRKRFFKLALKQAKLRSLSEGYKVYVVRDTRFTFRLLSTLDFKHNKHIKVFKKNRTFKDVERIAAAIVSPDGTVTGKGLSGDIKHTYVKPETNNQRKKSRTKKKHYNNQPLANPKNKKPENEKKDEIQAEE